MMNCVLVCLVENNNLVESSVFITDNQAEIMKNGKRMVPEAETLFLKYLSKENLTDEEKEECLMDGWYDFEDSITSVYISWPRVIT